MNAQDSIDPNTYLIPSGPVDPFEGLTFKQAMDLVERMRADIGMLFRRLAQKDEPSRLVLVKP